MSSSSSKKKNEWISSSFGHFTSTQSSQAKNKKPQKRKIDDRLLEEPKSYPSQLLNPCKVTTTTTTSLPWTKKYSPSTQNDLAVHKKKIAEVKDWLLSNLSTTVDRKNKSNILVLTGPAGAGKSATIDVLRRDLQIEVQEWSTPFTNTNEEYSSWKDFRVLSIDSQKKQFQDFLLRANKYPSLSISEQESAASVSISGQKIILVEDIPNVFYRNVQDFHGILRNFRTASRNPLVFIISDSYIGESSVYSLFPKRIQLELKITCINFNAISHSSLMKTVNSIISSESQLVRNQTNNKSMKIPTKDMLDLIITSANGDIRACINSLQFYCTNESTSKSIVSTPSVISSVNKPIERSKVKQPSSDDDGTVLFGRDTSLFLFKALGKILYCKREHSGENERSKELPKHLKHHARDKLLINPEGIVEKTHVASDVFNLYIHQNYLGFYTNISDVANACQFFSDADIITGNWSTRDALQNYSSSIATRGVVFSNCHRSNSSTGSVSGGWRSLRKPQWYEAFKEGNLNRRTAKDLFYDLRHPAVDLHTEILPFIATTNIPLQTPNHIAFVQMISQFKINTSRSSSTLAQNEIEPLDERPEETADENNRMASNQCKDENVSLSQVLAETQQSKEDDYEEGLIESFSDEECFEDLLM